jgi:hypothetical protein
MKAGNSKHGRILESVACSFAAAASALLCELKAFKYFIAANWRSKRAARVACSDPHG